MPQKLIVKKDLMMLPEKQHIIGEFCIYCMDQLGMGSDIDTIIQIESDRDSSGIKTTAYYNPADNNVRVYGSGRSIADICRSIAHELVHMSQHVRGLIGKDPIKDIGGFHEDEANAVAGQLIKMFAKDVTREIYESRM
jgi:hypothetical protein